METKITETERLRAALTREREKVRWLRAVLQAAQVQWDRGPCPRKLDDSMTWRENDEMIAVMVSQALAETEEEK